MKKIICLVFILTLFALLPFSVSADEIIGEVYTTDITAYINGYEIPAYNIGGSVAVAVADLRNYGFTVEYDNNCRQSSVVLNPNTVQLTPLASEQQSDLPLGTKVMNVYASDIVVTLNGASVDSFNIGGRMAVRFSDLKTFGIHVYDNDERTTNLWIKELSYFFYTEKLVEDGITPRLLSYYKSLTLDGTKWYTDSGKTTKDNNVLNAMISHLLGRLLNDDMTEIEKISAIYDYIVTEHHQEKGQNFRIPESWKDIAADFFSNDTIIYGINLEAFLSYAEKYSSFVESHDDSLRFFYHDTLKKDSGILKFSKDMYQTDAYSYQRVYHMLSRKFGVCSAYAAMLKCMVNHIGYESTIIYGEFIYNDGSTTEHLWNNILIDGKYYWFDTDLDSINWHNYYSSYDYIVTNYFMKKDSDWTSNHKWNTS